MQDSSNRGDEFESQQHLFFHFKKVCLHRKHVKMLLFVCVKVSVHFNNFSVMSGRSHRFLGITSTFLGVKCLAQGHNTAEVGFEPQTSRSGVRCCTTEQLRSPYHTCFILWENGIYIISTRSHTAVAS